MEQLTSDEEKFLEGINSIKGIFYTPFELKNLVMEGKKNHKQYLVAFYDDREVEIELIENDKQLKNVKSLYKGLGMRFIGGLKIT